MKTKKSILIVDDEKDFGETLKAILGRVYEEVIYLSSPAEAQSLIKTRAFSLIISDVHMPEMPGPDFVRIVRAFGRLEPIVFLTGSSSNELVLSALRLGAADVIEKPIGADELVQSIDRIFEIEKRRETLAEESANRALEPENLEKQRKMIGLLQIAKDKRKVG